MGDRHADAKIKIPLIKLNNGRDMPLLGLGTYEMSKDDAYKAVIESLKIGYRLIDTASVYRNEESIGRALRDSRMNRSEIFLSSKLGPGEQGFERATNAFHESIAKLGTEYLDLYLIHWPGTSAKVLKEDKMEEKELRIQSWLALEKLYKEGKCKSIGVSNFTVDHLKQLLEDERTTIVPAINQVELHPKLVQIPLREYCKEKGVQIEAYSSLVRGMMLEEQQVVKIASKYKKSTAQILLKWAIQRNIVVIPKSVHPQRIRENAELFDFELDGIDVKELDGMNSDYHCCWDPTPIT
eukprot:TRINITY_DN5465_c0_g1_i5.p1 TRINITY_DN5465_c0_g1~~TRINITY_DN5465_c0_g1_i5.p1  ORF type:complete len:296 (+),score=96.69 TRINITY_DN5465_c0_g1_i5:77-964(+)